MQLVVHFRIAAPATFPYPIEAREYQNVSDIPLPNVGDIFTPTPSDKGFEIIERKFWFADTSTHVIFTVKPRI